MKTNNKEELVEAIASRLEQYAFQGTNTRVTERI